MADIKEITLNNSTYDIKAKSIVDQGGGSLKMWTGTQAEYDAITTKDTTTLYNITDSSASMGSKDRVIGQLVHSILPLTDAGLHLLDGALIDGSGAYASFVQYIAGLYNNSSKYSNVTKVGSVTDNNGVISGFSTNPNYFYISNLTTGSNTIEIVQKITTGSLTADQNILAYGYNGDTQKSIAYNIYPTGKIGLYVSGDSSTWNILENAQSTLTLSANTTYYIKISYDGTSYKVDVSTTGAFSGEETNYITQTGSQYYNLTSSCTMGLWTNSPAINPFLGSIDLNECYIKMDGTIVWQGRMPICFTTEANWQASVTTYGVCGKFVYDSVNNTVRLPKITGIIEGTVDATALGDLVEAGLPNITGNLAVWASNGVWGLVSDAAASNFNAQGGAFQTYSRGWTQAVQTGKAEASEGVNFDASRSSSIYGNSTTVQPQTIKAFIYIVIATSAKTDIQVDIDNIATDLNGKANTDLTNVNSSGTTLAAGWSMPSATTVFLAVGKSGTTYTAPANGWATVSLTVTGTHGWGLLTSNNIAQHCYWPTTGGGTQAHIPVSKGSIFGLYYGEATCNSLVFVYAVGSESEAQ